MRDCSSLAFSGGWTVKGEGPPYAKFFFTSLDGQRRRSSVIFLINIIMLLDMDLYLLHNTVYVNQYLLKEP